MLEKWDDSFAKNQLEKYGWKNGEGLGKNKHGNAKHIAVKVKNDTKGVGKSQEQWDFAWWDHLYNKSASSVSVEKDAEANEIRIATKKKSDNRKSETGILSTYKPTAQGIKKSTNRTQEEEMTSSSMAAMADQANLMDSVKSVHSSMAQTIARSSLYSGFVKSAAVLPSETSTPQSTSSSNTNTDDNDSDNDDGKDYSIKMTDAELFAACEGRTARKGGLGLVEQKGKYARVMQDYLAHQNKEDDITVTQKRKRDEDDSKIEKKKKKKKSKDNDEEKKEKKKSKKNKKDKKEKKNSNSGDKDEKKDKKKKKSKKEKN